MSAWADTTVTFTAGTDVGSMNGSNSANQGEDEITKDGVTIATSKGAFAAAQYRIYKDATLTISTASGSISKIELTHSGSSYPASLLSTSTETYTVDSNSDGTWTGNANSVTFTASAQFRSSKIVVTVEETSDPTAPSATLSVSSLDFGEVIFGQTKSMTFTVTPANLTDNLTISCNNDKYEVSSSTIAQETTTATTITITAKPTAIDDDMDGTITISGGGLASAKTVTLSTTVTKRDAVAPAGPSASTGYYELVTDASTLAEDDELLFVSGSKALSTTQNNNNRGAVDVTFNDDDQIISATNAQVITLEGEEDAWYFNVGDNAYLYASSNSSNQMKTATLSTVGDNGKATITIDETDYLATIDFQGTNSRKEVRYNGGGSSNLFACYATTQATNNGIVKPQIYRYVPGTPANTFNITIGSAGYKTLVSSVDFETPEGVTAYIVTASSASSATLTSVSEVPAGTPVILKGSGTVTLDVIDNAATVNGNLLQVSTENTGNGVYVLANKNDVVGFYLWKGGSLGAGRVYLPAPAGAREFIGFGDEATGIKDYTRETTTNNRCYNLNGQRVDAHQKGLYIVNGKKVIIK